MKSKKSKVEAGEDKGSRKLDSSQSYLICCSKCRVHPKGKLFPGIMHMNVTGIRLLKANCTTTLSAFWRNKWLRDQGESMVASCFDSSWLTNWGDMDWIAGQQKGQKKFLGPWGSKRSIIVSLNDNWLDAVFHSGQYWETFPSDLDARTESILSKLTGDIKQGKQSTCWRAAPSFRGTSANWRKRPTGTL